MKEYEPWKIRTMLIGTLIGAISGLLAGLILVKRAESVGEPTKITTGEGVQLGLGVLGLFRMLTK